MVESCVASYWDAGVSGINGSAIWGRRNLWAPHPAALLQILKAEKTKAQNNHPKNAVAIGACNGSDVGGAVSVAGVGIGNYQDVPTKSR
jgi:hypothetical protein